MPAPEATEGPSDAVTADLATPARVEKDEPTDRDSPNEEPFSRQYVEKLRAEARENRLKAQRADFLATEVRRYAIKEAAAAAGLVDPAALVWDDDYADADTGLPDHDRLVSAARELAASAPWLTKPRGPLPGQGEHGTGAAALSLSELLRA